MTSFVPTDADRLDLAYALCSGETPFFQHEVVDWELSPSIAPAPLDMYYPAIYWDYRLTSLLSRYQHVAVKINKGVQQGIRFTAPCFQSSINALQSRLIQLQDLEEPLQELVRLSLLALLTTVYRRPGFRTPYAWVSRKISALYAQVAPLMDDILHLWVLVVATISVIVPTESWLQEAWKNIVVPADWVEMKSALMSVLWIECVHDQAGESLHRELMIGSGAYHWSLEGIMLAS